MSINTNVMKKFLFDMQVKGAHVCDGVEIGPDGDLFTSDGTAVTSFVRDFDVVFGQYDEATDTFTSGGDPASSVDASDKYYMRLVRGRGDVTYKEMRGLNDLIQKDVDGTALVDSIQDFDAQIQLLDSAAQSVITNNQAVTEQDADRLESAFDNYISGLKYDLDKMIEEMIRFSNVRDAQILADIKQQLANNRTAINETFASDAGVFTASWGAIMGSSHIEFFRPIDAADSDRKMIQNWAIKASTLDTNSPFNVLIGDSIMFTAETSTAFWQDAGQTQLGSVDAGFGTSDCLKVTVSSEQCGTLTSGQSLVVSCHYAGDLSAQDQPTQHTFDDLTDDLENYNMSGGVSTMGQVGKENPADAAAGSLVDSDVEPVTEIKISPATWHNV